jgi:hypothetical protein
MLSERKFPSSHMHMSTLLDRAGDVESGGHCMHTSGVVARTVTENLSSAQSVRHLTICFLKGKRCTRVPFFNFVCALNAEEESSRAGADSDQGFVLSGDKDYDGV